MSATEETSDRAANTPEQHPLLQSIVLHLLPGLLVLIFYILTAPLAQKMGLPSLFALIVAIAVILIPFELGYLLVQSKKRNGSFSLKDIVLYREPIPVWQYVVHGFVIFMWMGLFFGMLAQPVDKYFIDHFFSWVPDWFFILGPTHQLDQYSKSALLLTAIVGLVFNGVAGPVVEELYFRGYLLPRLSRLKGWAPLLNILLFSLYHFFTPWENLIRIFAITPLIYAVWWKKNIYLGMIVHCAGNLVGSIGMLALVLGRP